MSQDVMMQLYRTLVRLHLEYCIESLLSHYRKDAGLPERCLD